MIGKSLNERFAKPTLTPASAVARLSAALRTHAQAVIDVRAQGGELIAVVAIGESTESDASRLLGELGFELKKGAVGVIGLAGAALVRVLGPLAEAERAWLVTPARPRETKVLLAAGGIAFLSVDTEGGRTSISAAHVLETASEPSSSAG